MTLLAFVQSERTHRLPINDWSLDGIKIEFFVRVSQLVVRAEI